MAMRIKFHLNYCKVRNISVEVILATLTSRSDSLILRSVNMCSISYSNCVSSHNYTWSFDSHKYCITLNCILFSIVALILETTKEHT